MVSKGFYVRIFIYLLKSTVGYYDLLSFIWQTKLIFGMVSPLDKQEDNSQFDIMDDY